MSYSPFSVLLFLFVSSWIVLLPKSFYCSMSFLIPLELFLKKWRIITLSYWLWWRKPKERNIARWIRKNLFDIVLICHHHHPPSPLTRSPPLLLIQCYKILTLLYILHSFPNFITLVSIISRKNIGIPLSVIIRVICQKIL